MRPEPFAHPAFRGRFGVARRDISPPLEIYSRNWGAAKTDQAQAHHRPLTLSVLVIQEASAGDALALLALDLGWWRSSEEAAVLGRAVEESGFPAGHYMLALSHTHSGPVFCPGDAGKPGGELIGAYLRHLAKQIREALAEALDAMQDGLLEVATGSCGLAANRDLPDPDQDRLLVGWNPELPADDTLLVGRVSDEAGNCLATLVNYACHPTILAWENTSLSPDYIGAMRELIESETQAPTLFLQGASGDLAARHQYVGDLEPAERAGRALGHAVLGVFYEMLPPGDELAYQGARESGASLALWRTRRRESLPGRITRQDLPLALPLKEGLPSREEIRQEIAACSDHVIGERLQRKLLQRNTLGDAAFATRRNQLWRIGDIFLLSLPDEAYSVLQVELRRTAGKLPVLLATVTNGSCGYLSPRSSYDADSYASVQSPYAPGSFEMTLASLQTRIQDLL